MKNQENVALNQNEIDYYFNMIIMLIKTFFFVYWEVSPIIELVDHITLQRNTVYVFELGQ